MHSFLQKVLDRLRSGISRMFVAREDDTKAEVVAVLREVDLFKSLTRRQLYHIAATLHRRHYKNDEIVYYAGDPGLGLYIIEDGAVELVRKGIGASTVSSTLVPNDVFGIASMFGDVRREETARAKQQTSLLGLFSPELKSLVRRNPAVGSALLLVLAENLAETLVTYSQNSVIASNVERQPAEPGTDVVA